MSSINQFQTKKQIQEQACLWINHMDRGLSQAEKKELVIWCNQNAEHHNTLLEMASYWDDISVLNELTGLFPAEKTHKKQNTFISIALAASVTVVSLLTTNALVSKSFLPFIPSMSEQALTQTLTLKTSIGEHKNFTMSDGTTIQLNTNSTVNVAYSPSARQLTLMQGEAKFDVAKDKSRPFTVIAENKSFTALGTIFNIQKNGHLETELVVTEGRVLISQANEKIAVLKQALLATNDNTLLTNKTGIVVTSGEKAIITNHNEIPIKKTSIEEVERDLAWQNGMLIFDGTPLASALDEVARYTSNSFSIATPSIEKIKVSGYFKANDIDGLLASLESNFHISYEKNSDRTITLTLTE